MDIEAEYVRTNTYHELVPELPFEVPPDAG